jgi:hypothetical protein
LLYISVTLNQNLMKNPTKKSYLLLFIIFLFAVSCKKSELQGDLSKNGKTATSTDGGEDVEFKFKDGTSLTVRKFGDKYVMGGDVILSPEQVSYLKMKTQSNNLQTNSTFNSELVRLWPNGVVYYTIEDVGNQATILQAMTTISSSTPVTFVERSWGDHVKFTCCPQGGSAGDSQIGKMGGEQLLRLQPNASSQTVIHEICHALGLYHEQCRADRDDYIIVNYSNINGNFTHNYDKVPVWFATYSGSFDYYSIMMYPDYAPSAGYPGNSNPQLEVKPGISAVILPSSGLTSGDIQGIIHLYNPGIYAKLKAVNTFTNTYYGMVNEVEEFEYDYSVEFFSDAAFTQPTTLPNAVMLKYASSQSALGQGTSTFYTDILVNAGSSSVYLGHGGSRRYWEYGNLTTYEESSFYVRDGVGYKR